MTFGKWNQFPIFLGRNNTWKLIHDSYREGRGTVLGIDSETRTSRVWAKSRALYVAHNQAQRIKHLWDPFRMVPQILERWETVLSLPKTGTKAERRSRVAARFQRFGMEATHQKLADLATEIAGVCFDSVEYTSPTAAAATGYAATVPGGIAGPNIEYEDGDWRSAAYFICVRLSQPEAMPDGELLELGNRMVAELSDLFPAYVRIGWARVDGGFILGSSLLGMDSFG